MMTSIELGYKDLMVQREREREIYPDGEVVVGEARERRARLSARIGRRFATAWSEEVKSTRPGEIYPEAAEGSASTR